ncbi:YceI family protein [Streptomyces sp. NPDC002490]|uniref:YceI family protein n=1 Tax=Streptomyces sp. NPDC002490 TaxID=3154416 RepID=UPI00331BC0A7
MALFGRKNESAAALATAAPDFTSLTGSYALDPAHTAIGFVARHAMVTNVKGAFDEVSGTLDLDGADPTRSRAVLDIQMASINTGNADRDGHLRSADFFRIDEFPTMTFRSTRTEHVGGEEFQMIGDLSILGTTRPIALALEFNGAATDPFGNQRVGFEGKAELLRSEWGLTWNAALETGGVLVSDKIKLNFDVSAIRSAD